MTFSEYLENQHHDISFDAARDKIYNRIKGQLYNQQSAAECKTLQDFLNQAFYPDKYGMKNGQNYSQSIKTLIEKAYEEKYSAAVNNFSMGASGVGYGNISMETLPTLIRNKHETFSHTNRIYIATIQDRLTRVKAALQSAYKIDAPEIEAYKTQLRSIQTLLNKLLKLKGSAVNANSDNAYFDLKGQNSNLLSMIQTMDEQFKAASTIGGLFSPQDYGQVLEWVLQAFSGRTNEAADSIAETMVDDFITTAGSSTTGKSNLKFDRPSKTNIKKVKNNFNKDNFSLVAPNGDTFSMRWINKFDPDKNRQGKMDVDFNLNTDVGTTVPFRISAKNWQTLDRDFGETNVIYALLRSAGNESAVEYCYAMQDDNEINVDAAHKLAKFSLLVDILMGYSQKENFADTLVINIRSEQRVIVASIIDIIDEINRSIDSFYLLDYDHAGIDSQLKILRNGLQAADAMDEYQSLAMKYLQTISVKIRYAEIAHAIHTPLSTMI